MLEILEIYLELLFQLNQILQYPMVIQIILHLKGLLGLGGQHQRTLHDQGRADINFGNFLEIGKGIVIDNLNRIEVSTVIQDDKAKLLASPAVSYPTAYFNFLTGVFFGIAEQFSHGNQFHNGVLSFI